MKYVYLFNVEGTDVYKIGISKNPKKRRPQVQTGCPYKVVEVYRFESKYFNDIETRLHSQYSLHKIDEYGRELQGEFFYLSKDDRDMFLENCRKSEELFLLLEDNAYVQSKKKTR